MQQELKSYPFCGGKPELHIGSNGTDEMSDIFIECEGCGISLQFVVGNEDEINITVENWNTRAPSQTELVGKLVAVSTRVADWFDAQAKRDEMEAKNSRFDSIRKAYISDAKNYRAMSRNLREALGLIDGVKK